MLCKAPFRNEFGEFGCGQCLPCRINRRRIWTGRIVLESFSHAASSFVTLTYADTPRDLQPRDWQLFMKRLRKEYVPERLRYFAVGEYGDISFRPHYHVCLFGVAPIEGEVVARAWRHGFVHMGELNHNSAQYCAGYVTKKMTKADDGRLDGRFPEFSRMSLRPGIGRLALDQIAEQFFKDRGSKGLLSDMDVPREVRIEGKKYPLCRYTRSALRSLLGWSEKTPIPVVRKMSVERSLRTGADLNDLARKRGVSDLRARARVRRGEKRKL